MHVKGRGGEECSQTKQNRGRSNANYRFVEFVKERECKKIYRPYFYHYIKYQLSFLLESDKIQYQKYKIQMYECF